MKWCWLLGHDYKIEKTTATCQRCGKIERDIGHGIYGKKGVSRHPLARSV